MTFYFLSNLTEINESKAPAVSDLFPRFSLVSFFSSVHLFLDTWKTRRKLHLPAMHSGFCVAALQGALSLAFESNQFPYLRMNSDEWFCLMPTLRETQQHFRMNHEQQLDGSAIV